MLISIQKLQREIERLKAKENNDGTTSGIPTSQTPIGKKKVIPNFAKNTGEKIGRKQGHKKDKLEKVSEEKINNHVEHKMEECPACHKKDLKSTGKVIKKQVKDYYIIVNIQNMNISNMNVVAVEKNFMNRFQII